MSSHFPTSLSLHIHIHAHTCTRTHSTHFLSSLCLRQPLIPHCFHIPSADTHFSFTFGVWLGWTPSCYTPHTDTPPSISSNPNPHPSPCGSSTSPPRPPVCLPLQAGNWQAHTPSLPTRAPCHARSPGHPARGFCSEARRAQLPPQRPWVPAMQAAAGAASSSASMHGSAEKGTRYNLFRKQ